MFVKYKDCSVDIFILVFLPCRYHSHHCFCIEHRTQHNMSIVDTTKSPLSWCSLNHTMRFLSMVLTRDVSLMSVIDQDYLKRRKVILIERGANTSFYILNFYLRETRGRDAKNLRYSR